MSKRLIAALSSVALLLGLTAVVAAPASAEQLSVGGYYCLASPTDPAKIYSAAEYEGPDSDAYFNGKMYATMPPIGCQAYDGTANPIFTSGPPVTDLVPSTKYCLGVLDTLAYTSRVYQYADDAAFKDKAIRAFPTTGDCTKFNGQPLYSTELIYYSYPEKPIPEPKIDVPTSSPNIPDITTPLPTGRPYWPNGGMGNVCTYSGTGTWSIFFDTDTEANRPYLNDRYVRPFPMTLGQNCSTYNNIPLGEWEYKFGYVPPSFLNPNVTIPDGSSVTYDPPSSDGGEGGADFSLDPKTELAGCNGPIQLRSSNWTLDWQYIYFHIILGARDAKIRLSVAINYWYCPNGAKADKIRPVTIQYIATHFKKPPGPYQNARFNVVMSDSNTRMDMEEYKLQRNGDSLQQEKKWYIAVEKRKWFRIDQNAQWGNTTFLTLQNPSLDPEFTFHIYDQPNVKRMRFNPAADQVLGPWM